MRNQNLKITSAHIRTARRPCEARAHGTKCHDRGPLYRLRASCPIGRALASLGLRNINVETETAYARNREGTRYEMRLSGAAKQIVRAWDAGKRVKPTTLRIEPRTV